MSSVNVHTFEWSGPQNVPGFARYTYTASGGNPGAWIDAVNKSTAKAPVSTFAPTGQSVDILWGEGGVVGHPIYRAAANFTWAYDVNIVKVQLDTANSQLITRTVAIPADPWIGMRAWLPVTRIEGPVVNKISRGVRFIEAGFIQHLTFTRQQVVCKAPGLAEKILRQELTGRPGRWLEMNSPTNPIGVRGSTGPFLDAETDTQRSELPWLDSFGVANRTLGGVSYFGGTPLNETTPVPASTFRTRDVPHSGNVRATLFDRRQIQPYEPRTVNSVWDFNLYFAVRTTEDVNDSANTYAERAVATWQYTRRGAFGTPVDGWGPAATGFAERREGRPITPTTPVYRATGRNPAWGVVNDLINLRSRNGYIAGRSTNYRVPDAQNAPRWTFP